MGQETLFGIEIEKENLEWKPKTEEDLKKEWEEEIKKMRKAGFTSLGFYLKNNKLYFWTHCEKQECFFKEIEGIVQYSDKPYGLVYGLVLYDEYGQHTHTWMITKDFGDWLIKELNMKKEKDYWKNPNFVMGNPIELEIKKKSEELKELLKRKYGYSVKIRVFKNG